MSRFPFSLRGIHLDTRKVVHHCFHCENEIREDEEYYDWGEPYCSKDCLKSSVVDNLSEVIDEIAEVRRA